MIKFSTKLLIFIISMQVITVNAQKKITLDNIYKERTFSQNNLWGINWMNDGQYYSALEANNILQYDVHTGKVVHTILEGDSISQKINISGYEFSKNEDKILLTTSKKYIYRRSFLTEYYVYDRNTKKATPLSTNGKQANAKFSPDGTKVAFTRENNLFYLDLATGTEKQITSNGKWNEIINGSTDWVYEEEFYLVKAYWWSPDGNTLLYMSFDESDVPTYNMQKWNQGALYPEDYTFKYPKAGEANSVIGLHLYDLATEKQQQVNLGKKTDIYIPRAGWTKDSNTAYFVKLNRKQNKWQLYNVNRSTAEKTLVLEEKSKTYIDVNYCDDLQYLEDGEHFLYTSEKSGFKHIYLYKTDGSLVRQITKGDWEVVDIVGILEKGKKTQIFFTSTESSPLDRDFYQIDLSGKTKKKLSTEKGTTSVNMSPDAKYYIRYFSNSEKPLTVDLIATKKNKLVKNIKNNDHLKDTINAYQLVPKEFIKVPNALGTSLNGYMLKPLKMEEGKKYPVLMYQYSGPQSQEVANSWGGRQYYWHQMLVQHGYIVVVVDGRGTGFRGESFTKITYKELGKYEVEDQISAAKHLATLPYVDANRIGIWGWSFGGFMAANCMFKGADVFKTGISVAPVTNWRFYDTIYTERYMQRPQDNASGYDDNSPIHFADQLKGKYLLIHGTGDDNVHFQNAVALQDALIQAGKQFDSFYYPDNAHGIYRRGVRVHLFQKMTDFILENL